jgi:hypothetical protein
MAIITAEEFKAYIGDTTDCPTNATVIGAAEDVVKGHLGYDPAKEDAVAESLELEAVDYVALRKPVIAIAALTLEGVALVAGSDYRVSHNYLLFFRRRSGTLAVTYSGGIDPIPALVKLACLQIAALKHMETGKHIGVTGTAMPDGMGTQFINYTSYDKYLRPLSRYRIC